MKGRAGCVGGLGLALAIGATLAIGRPTRGGAKAAAAPTDPYPLDGYARTGIRRLEAYRRVQTGELPGRRLHPGALLETEEIRLRLLGSGRRFELDGTTPRDPGLQEGLEDIFRGRDPHYSVAVLDITDPTRPRYAAIDETTTYQPGSIGKLVVMTGLFDQLARIWPDTTDRIAVLAGTSVTADGFALPDHHAVPIVDLETGTLHHRVIRRGDTFSLWEWVDHMVSPSSNGAGAMVWKEALMMDRFGARYPMPPSARVSFLEETGRLELRDAAVRTVNAELRRLGISGDAFRQGTFFTSGAQRVIPGVRSYVSPRALLAWMVKLEQGRVVDRWSSLEMKRLLYFTRGRYRYASSPALRDAAVYFKSGSLYACRPEPGFQCRQYMGNRVNTMNSMAIVESPARGSGQRVYLVALMSNVLKVNSAVEHQTLATFIERLMRRLHGEPADRPSA